MGLNQLQICARIGHVKLSFLLGVVLRTSIITPHAVIIVMDNQDKCARQMAKYFCLCRSGGEGRAVEKERVSLHGEPPSAEPVQVVRLGPLTPSVLSNSDTTQSWSVGRDPEQPSRSSFCEISGGRYLLGFP